MGCGASSDLVLQMEAQFEDKGRKRTSRPNRRKGNAGVSSVQSFESTWAQVIVNEARQRVQRQSEERHPAGKLYRENFNSESEADPDGEWHPKPSLRGEDIDLDKYGDLPEAKNSMDPDASEHSPPGLILTFPPDRYTHDKHVRKVRRFLEQLQQEAEPITPATDGEGCTFSNSSQ